MTRVVAMAAATMLVLAIPAQAVEPHTRPSIAGLTWKPTALAFSADGSQVYAGGLKRLHILDAGLTRELGSVAVSNTWLRDLAVDPSSGTVYATSDDNRLYAVSPSDAEVLWSVEVGRRPEGIAVTPDGSRAYVANTESGTVSTVDLSARTVTATIPVGSDPIDVAVQPDGWRVYVALRGEAVLPIVDVYSDTVLERLPVDGPATSIAMSPTDDRVFVVTGGGSLTVVRASDGTVETTISVGQEPTAVAVSKDGGYVYVRDRRAGQVMQVDIATMGITGRATTGGTSASGSPEHLVTSPTGTHVYFQTHSLGQVARIAIPFQAPSAPQSARAVAGVLSARVSWTKPRSIGSAPAVLSYVVTAVPGDRSCTAKATAGTCTITGLEAGRTLRFSVRAQTSNGPGAVAMTRKVTIRGPYRRPTAPPRTPAPPPPPTSEVS